MADAASAAHTAAARPLVLAVGHHSRLNHAEPTDSALDSSKPFGQDRAIDPRTVTSGPHPGVCAAETGCHRLRFVEGSAPPRPAQEAGSHTFGRRTGPLMLYSPLHRHSRRPSAAGSTPTGRCQDVGL